MKGFWQTSRQTFKEMEKGILDLKQETWIQALFCTN